MKGLDFYGKYISPRYSHTLGGFIKDLHRVGLRKAMWLWKTETRILQEKKR